MAYLSDFRVFWACKPPLFDEVTSWDLSDPDFAVLCTIAYTVTCIFLCCEQVRLPKNHANMAAPSPLSTGYPQTYPH